MIFAQLQVILYYSHDELKKTRSAGGDRPHGITLRRRPSHASLENPRTPAPPIYSGPLPVRKAGSQLCFGHGTSEGVFFPVRAGDRTPDLVVSASALPPAELALVRFGYKKFAMFTQAGEMMMHGLELSDY